MTLPDRLVDAAIAQGPDSPAARLLRVVEAVERVAVEEDDMGVRIAPDLADLIDRAWLVAA